MFVGDSLSLNQWVSLSCMLHASLPPNSNVSISENRITRTHLFRDFELSVIYYHSLFLVDVVLEPSFGRVLDLDSIEQGRKNWVGIDMFIFNTWHWWSRKGPSQPYVCLIYIHIPCVYIYQNSQIDDYINSCAGGITFVTETLRTGT